MKFYFDKQRHLVCVPYSIENLHKMAVVLGIHRCWFHNNDTPHYDVPKKRMKDIGEFATEVSPRQILRIIRGDTP